MGGHVEACRDCGAIRHQNNSCRNRNCPKCGSIDKEKWTIAREADLLPVKYFHVVFTVPDKLNPLFMDNQETMYNLLFSVAWDVLKDFGNDPKWLGGKLGATAILHTWGQNLHFHPHLHFIVPAGALMPNRKWKHSRARGKYLFKVEQLSEVFRGRFVEQARELVKKKQARGKVPGNLFDKDWVVYAKQPFGGPQQVIKYLSRYTHRTAISNDRILKVSKDSVTFSWRDYARDYKQQTTTLPGREFLRLFAMHILPPGFTRIRHFGFLSSASKTKSLAIIRACLKVCPPPVACKEKISALAMQRMGIKPGFCNHCGGTMAILDTFPNQFHEKSRAPPKNYNHDLMCHNKTNF